MPSVSDIAFMFVTFNRPQAARDLIESVRRFYPNMKILAGDQTPPSDEMDAFYRDHDVDVHYMPYDSGVSYCRSRLVRKIDRLLVLYADDDNCFTERTQFDAAIRILEGDRDIGLLAGSKTDIHQTQDGFVRRRRRYEKLMEIDREKRQLVSTPIDFVSPETGSCGRERYYYCDLTLNWALCRRELFDDDALLWDDRFKTNGEHENFFLQLKYFSPYRVAYYPGMHCDHFPMKKGRYGKKRSRLDGWRMLGEKWDLETHLEVGYGLRQFDDYEAPPDGKANVTAWRALPKKRDSYVRLWPDGYAEGSSAGEGQGGGPLVRDSTRYFRRSISVRTGPPKADTRIADAVEPEGRSLRERVKQMLSRYPGLYRLARWCWQRYSSWI